MAEIKAGDMQNYFQIGQIVHLKSGSPDLRVIDIDGEDVVVSWRGDDSRLQAHAFPGVCLRKVHTSVSL
jgi:uncharacterized protein YodC (DUF2158 family)